MASEYPEHDKLRAIRHQSQTVGDFLEWLEENGMEVGVWDGDWFHPSNRNKESLLAAYFEIDQAKLEREKRVMIAELTGDSDG